MASGKGGEFSPNMQGTGTMRSVFALLLVLVVFVAATPAVRATETPQEFSFHIPAQPLMDALLSYSEQARVQLILAVDTSALPPSRALHGRMNAEDAIERLLQHSGLEYYFSSANTVTVRRVPPLAVRTDASDRLKSPPQPAN